MKAIFTAGGVEWSPALEIWPVGGRLSVITRDGHVTDLDVAQVQALREAFDVWLGLPEPTDMDRAGEERSVTERVKQISREENDE